MFHAFLKNIEGIEGRILLALSGGVDSMLLYSFLKKISYLQIHVAHVDHRWSSQSAKIAKDLETLCKKDKIPFHLHVIKDIDKNFPNAEDLCRQERLKFFSSVYERIEAKALMLGHHADDQIEVVLKRVFEGSYITNCSGMSIKMNRGAMKVYRPFIDIRKSIIRQQAKKDGIIFFEDPSNSDLRFLRARFRHELMQQIHNSFGKPIEKSLLHIAKEITEIESFLQEDFLSNQYRFRDLGYHKTYNIEGLNKAQIRYAVKKICQTLCENINREQMRIILDSIDKNRSGSRAILSRFEVVLEKKNLNFALLKQ